jgi:hypothetical protein
LYTNYEGMNGLHYLDAQTLEQAFTPQPTPGNPKGRLREVIKRPNNYTTTQLYFQPNNTQDYTVELQIRGTLVNRVAEAEHLYYAIQRKKDLSKGNPQLKALLTPIEKTIQHLSASQQASYQAYLASCYKTARLRETGKPAYYPPLPVGISPLLEVNHLRMIKEQMARVENPHLPIEPDG